MTTRDFYAEVQREREAERMLANEFHGDVQAMGPALLELRAAYDALRARLAEVERERDALAKERGELRQRVEQAEKAARVTIDECRRQGVSVGRSLANYGLKMAERERDALRGVVEAARAYARDYDKWHQIRREQGPDAARDFDDIDDSRHDLLDAVRALDAECEVTPSHRPQGGGAG